MIRRNHNVAEQKKMRRELRANATPAEATLWLALKAKRLDGTIWRRQFSIGSYILDFYCPAAKLCVELDGANHYTSEGQTSDYIRTKYLKQQYGIEVLRFENQLIWKDPDAVLNKIKETIKNRLTSMQKHTPPPRWGTPSNLEGEL